MVNGGRSAALTPCVTTACTAGLPFLAHSPGQELQPSFLQPTAVVLGHDIPGNQISHSSSWIYAVVLLHLCLCTQPQRREKKSSWWESLVLILFVQLEKSLHSKLPSWQKNVGLYRVNLCEGWKQTQLHKDFPLYPQMKAGKTNPKNCSEF